MIKRSILFILIIMVLSIVGCIKETYNMKMLSKQAHLSPTLAISAVKGDVSFSDMVKANDTVTFDQNKLVILVFRKDSIIDLRSTDFSKASVKRTATINPYTFNLGIDDIIRHISGTFQIVNPSIKFSYSNSFPDSIKVTLSASGKRTGYNPVGLNLAPFTLAKPNIPTQQEISSAFVIDKNNSSLSQIVSLPPEEIDFSGNAVMTTYVKSDETDEYALGPDRLLGSLEIQIPLELKINNLQFTDTVDNFMKNDNSSNDNPVNPEDFQKMSIIFSAKNGFPLGASLKMSLYDPVTKTIKSTVEATDVLKPAPVDSNGKITDVAETSTTIEFTRDFFSFVNKADKIIFRFTLSSTGNGSQAVKIFSDYRISFKAVLIVKPDINLE